MGQRKFQADFIFSDGELLPSGSVLITDDNGTVKGISDARDAGDEIMNLPGMIVPGFVNAHCHLELSHMQHVIPPGTGLVPFLTRVIKERSFPASAISQAMIKAEEEMYDSGIVAVGDICNTTDSIPVKGKSRMRWFNFIEAIGFTKDKARERFDYANRVFAEYQQAFSSPNDNEPIQQFPALGAHSSMSLSPHAPYSVSEPLFRLLNGASHGRIISIHNQEAAAENHLYENKTGQVFELYNSLNIDASFFEASGKSSLQTYLPWLAKAAAIILVHNTYTNEADILFATSSNNLPAIFFCVCINANRYIEERNPPINLLRSAGTKICLGTDSYASNWQLNILAEIKTIQQQFSHIPLPEILQWATVNGAEALNMDDQLGSFKPGKQPGVVLIDKVKDGRVCDDAVATRII